MTKLSGTSPLKTLEDSYEIVGELGGVATPRRFLARRRANGASVVVTIARAPAGAESHELSHYAADVNLLATLRHPNIVPVIEARWIGPDELAVVAEGISGPTLADELDRGMRLRNPRIAAMLNDVWSALEWARDHSVVHRGAPPDSIYFEPTTGRLMVALSPMPIPITGVYDVAADARTIGALAWSLLSGAPRAASPAGGVRRLAELAPNLAERVVEAVESMLNASPKAMPDVPTCLGIIAAGDVFKQGEVEIAALKEEYEELHRAELAKCERLRLDVEQQAATQAATLAEERVALERRAADFEVTIAAERAGLEAMMAARRDQLMAQRADVERQAARVARGMPMEAAPDYVWRSNAGGPRLLPTGIAAAMMALAALVATAHQRAAISSSARPSVGSVRVVPAPRRIDSAALPRGGFLTQSVGGSIAPSASGPRPTSAADSVQAAANADSLLDSTMATAPPARAVKPPPPVRRQTSAPAQKPATPTPRPPAPPANDVNGMVPASSLFYLPPLKKPRDTTRRRDSLGRPDTLSRRDTLPDSARF